MSSTQDYYHISQSRLFLLLIVNTPTVRNQVPVIHNSFNFSVSVYMHNSVRVLNSYCHRTKLYELEYSVHVQFLLPIVLQKPLIPKVTKVSTFTSQPFSVMLFNMFLIWILLSQSVVHFQILCCLK